MCHWLLLNRTWNWSYVWMLSQPRSINQFKFKLPKCLWVFDQSPTQQWLQNNTCVKFFIIPYLTLHNCVLYQITLMFTKCTVKNFKHKFLIFNSYADVNLLYNTRVNYYSSSNSLVRFNTFATGNANNDNQALITLKRFLMSNVGNEALTCSATPISKDFIFNQKFNTSFPL